ncbi:SRPBCC family protein [Patulibacter sp.]|uniref:SRPBCC family protein n=1 Tax=Patulibacter sp. TaxID=1912859 RepID=UPI00271F7CA7|nr:SRPBCC family protein [Patulibacter sp.]MDO9409538.1 SRPBCC family protein [Patulibacter sp.]
METFRVELTAPLDPGALHAYLEDLAAHPEWRFDVASSVLAGGLTGGVGARYDQRTADDGRETEAELTDSERPTMVAFAVVDGHERLDVEQTFEPDGPGCRITMDVTTTWTGRPWHRRPKGRPSTEERAARYGRALAERLGGELL